MVNILNMDYRVNLPWCRKAYEAYIKPSDIVTIVPFSFRENEIKNITDWDKLYQPEFGKHYLGIAKEFMSYGISGNQIHILHYLEDSREEMIQKIDKATILYFPGGFPTLFYQRLLEFDLIPILHEFDGVVIGTSAGAMIQLDEYLITPDHEFKEVSVEPGIGMISSFCIEAHYRGDIVQEQAIKDYVASKRKDLYAITDQGAIILNNDSITIIGEVVKFSKEV